MFPQTPCQGLPRQEGTWLLPTSNQLSASQSLKPGKPDLTSKLSVSCGPRNVSETRWNTLALFSAPRTRRKNSHAHFIFTSGLCGDRATPVPDASVLKLFGCAEGAAARATWQHRAPCCRFLRWVLLLRGHLWICATTSVLGLLRDHVHQKMALFCLASCVCPIWPSSSSAGDNTSHLFVPSALFRKPEKPSPRSVCDWPCSAYQSRSSRWQTVSSSSALDAQTDRCSHS